MQPFLFSKTKCIYLLYHFLPIALLLLAGCQSAKELLKEPALPIFLIPAGYQGTLTLVNSEKCGIKPELENGLPLFRFPKDGLLILKENESHYNRCGAAYYFVDSAGHRQEITQVIDLWPNWNTDRNGSNNYLGQGNTTLEKYRRDQPVFVIRGMTVDYTEPIMNINGKTMNAAEASFAYLQYSVDTCGAADKTVLMMGKPDEGRVVKTRMLACKQRFAAATTSSGK